MFEKGTKYDSAGEYGTITFKLFSKDSKNIYNGFLGSVFKILL